MSRKRTRGVTIVEMMVTVTILGIFMLLIGYEFDHTVWHLFHTQSNVDTESNARVIMAKVVNGVKAATPNADNWSGGAVLLVPVNNAQGATNVLRYKRAQRGSLADPKNVRLDPQTGAPAPLFDQVQIACATACSPTTPDELVETTFDDKNPAQQTGSRVIGHDVTNFSVTNDVDTQHGMVTISLTVAHPYSVKTGNYTSPYCAPTCLYTVQSSVFVGGSSYND